MCVLLIELSLCTALQWVYRLPRDKAKDKFYFFRFTSHHRDSLVIVTAGILFISVLRDDDMLTVFT
jgi:hypothetical protein